MRDCSFEGLFSMIRSYGFWESAREAASALRSDPEAWAAEKRERELWESLDPKKEDGFCPEPVDRETLETILKW